MFYPLRFLLSSFAKWVISTTYPVPLSLHDLIFHYWMFFHVRLSKWKVCTENFSRTPQGMYRGIQFLKVFPLFDLADRLYFFLDFCYQFIQNDGFINVGEQIEQIEAVNQTKPTKLCFFPS
jgi:hypothetical protein